MVLHFILVGVRLAVVVAGLVLTYVSYDSYRRRHNSGSLLALSIAFALITLGAVVEGVLFEAVGYSLTQVHAAESAVTAVALMITLFAIYITR